ncbi:aminotransferase class I/II-fold pyridoxal phosphate-dependent enzyme [Paraflavitalea sp. CAU 1676]|uniref:pyridoxal phosphate-dependent aminotransferase n=1 Tax=Paraflavitalea sp. CAU 1676 TaxID=3032598 RepID=UPI0023DB3055|nr:aminotransferase class I/II-fold pyridoxal phosphate-dependent enzyme [Paraflavitalea sp. CAU 1676]MDF2192772.1 aminotransferase class I/II-fold pyridoxal phosphate-dependent enzyme [Paraflavitalea sp. CAU 1676]
MQLSQLAENLPGSGILAISAKIKQMIADGNKVDNFTVGDFDPQLFPIPAVLEEGIVQAYREHFTNYPAAEGNADLRKAIAQFIRQHQSLDYTTDEILVGSGGRPLIYALYRAIVDKGEKVIYPVPGWNNQYYAQFVEAEHCPVETSADNYFMPTANDLRPHLKGATLLALCSPQNPTGTCFTREGLLDICELVLEENNRRAPGEKKLYVFFDQMYSLLLHGNTLHHDPVSLLPAMRPYTIYLDAISKGFAATGVRVGWAFGPAPVLSKMKAILSHVGAWAPMAEQKAVASFLPQTTAVDEYLNNFRQEINLRLKALYKGFKSMKESGLPVDAIEPQAAIYLTVKIDLPDAHSLLLNKAGIGILPFAVFGAPAGSPWYRISVGTFDISRTDEVITRLENALVEEMALAH